MIFKITLGAMTILIGIIFVIDLILNQRIAWLYLIALGLYLWMYWMELISEEKK